MLLKGALKSRAHERFRSHLVTTDWESSPKPRAAESSRIEVPRSDLVTRAEISARAWHESHGAIKFMSVEPSEWAERTHGAPGVVSVRSALAVHASNGAQFSAGVLSGRLVSTSRSRAPN